MDRTENPNNRYYRTMGGSRTSLSGHVVIANDDRWDTNIFRTMEAMEGKRKSGRPVIRRHGDIKRSAGIGQHVLDRSGANERSQCSVLISRCLRVSSYLNLTSFPPS